MIISKTGLTGIPYLDEDDHAAGFNAIKLYHNYMVTMYDHYKIDLHTLISNLAKRTGGKFFIDGMGFGILENKMSNRQVQNAMERLARESKGQVPAHNSAFTQALISSASVSEWVDLPSFVILESAKDILGAGKVIGQSVIDIGGSAIESGKSLVENARYIVPVVIVVGVTFAIYMGMKK